MLGSLGGEMEKLKNARVGVLVGRLFGDFREVMAGDLLMVAGLSCG